jgi:hypothetical protein
MKKLKICSIQKFLATLNSLILEVLEILSLKLAEILKQFVTCSNISAGKPSTCTSASLNFQLA